MNVDEARSYMKPRAEGKSRVVTVKRNGAHWTGEVVAIVTEPALILEQHDGQRVAIVLSGSRVGMER